jgi:hypothetical protein
MAVYIAGNGLSRQSICLHTVKRKGHLYGCNSLFNDVIPDVLVATDDALAHKIQDLGYSLDNEFYTRSPYSDKGAKQLKQPYANWSSGANAVQVAILQGHTEIYLFGFDFGSTHDKFNNCYADTEFYKKSTDPATFGGNWLNQISTIMQHNTKINFTIVVGVETQNIDSLLEFHNVNQMSVSEFLFHINNV